ncbi:MAG: HAD hydrolase-like protein [Nanoarchaeota archaeon]
MIKSVIFDFNRTLFDPDKKALVEGALLLLQALQQQEYKLCLISRKTVEERQEDISRLGLDKFFMHIIVAEEKTQEHFSDCLNAMKLQGREVAVVGDRVRSEIYFGNVLGMRTIWFKVGKFAVEEPQKKEEEPNYVITDLGEVLGCLK